jgi:agmatine deiminase
LARAGLTAAGLAAAGTFIDVLGTSTSASAATWWVPGEEVAHKRTWMAWPSSKSIWGNALLTKIQNDIATLAKEIANYEPVIMCADGSAAATTARTKCGSNVTVISTIPINDCWMRDTGPLFRTNGAGGRDAIGLNFSGWGGKQANGKDKYVAERVAAYAAVAPFTKATVVGEGGGVEYDGDGTLIATESCWVNSNRNPGKTKPQIETELLNKFGATKVIWASAGIKGQDITDDHVDSTSRFVRPGVVMVQLAPASRTDIWAQDALAQFNTLSNSTDAKGRRLQVLTVEGPDSLPRWPQTRWDTFLDSYVNWAVTNTSVITVQFGDTAKDSAAKAAIQAAFPGKTVVQLNLDQLHGEGGGGAHCVTMQEPVL